MVGSATRNKNSAVCYRKVFFVYMEMHSTKTLNIKLLAYISILCINV